MRSTTGAADGHVVAVIKSDHAEAAAQVYSELAAKVQFRTASIEMVRAVLSAPRS